MRSFFYDIITVFLHLLPIQKNKIFFLGYYGAQYGCNPKYLSDYIVENCKDWDVVWGFTMPENHNIAGVRKVKYLSVRYFYELYTSKVFVTNYRMPEYYRKRNSFCNYF